LEDDKLILEKKKNSLNELKSRLVFLAGDLILATEKRKQKEKALKEIQGKIEEKRKLSEELGKSRIMLLSKKDNFSSNERIATELDKEIKKFQQFNFSKFRLQEIEEEILKLKKQRDKLNLIIIGTNSKISSLNLKIEENQNLQNKMSNLSSCPTCLQEVDAIYRANVLNKLHNEISKSTNEIKAFEIERLSTTNLLKKTELDLNFKEKELAETRILFMKSEAIDEKKIKLNSVMNILNELRKDINLLNSHIQSLSDSILEFSKFDRVFEEKEKDLFDTQKQERLAEIKVAELKKEIEFSSTSISELEKRLEKINEIKTKLDYISDLESWLTNKFVPVVSFIESNVMKKLKLEFSRLFAEWFAVLVPESFNVRLSDDFTPIIEQKDYEIDYAYLSGGERTAIALAYRLSLNQVLNSLMSKLKTRDLVILDEPTDGFSNQQLDKMREVLDELNTKQLILVSHEQKIEGFVQNVIRFKKQHGESFRV